MKISISLCIMLSFMSLAWTQTLSRSVIASTGSNNEQLSYTIGESVINTTSSGTLILTQGFQQPDQLSGTSIDHRWGTLHYLLYPNPTQASLVLKISSSKARRVHVSFCDAKGKIVMGAPDLLISQATKVQYAVGHFAAGAYVILLQDEAGDLIQSIRFIKTD